MKLDADECKPDYYMLSESQAVQMQQLRLKQLMEMAVLGNGTVNKNLIRQIAKEAGVEDVDQMLAPSASGLKEELKKLL